MAAILVESVRVDGKPKKRHIAYLAGISERQVDDTASQCKFWAQIVRKLDHMGNRVSEEDRQRIEKAIAERVRCPTRRQYDRWHREAERLFGHWAMPAVTRWPS